MPGNPSSKYFDLEFVFGCFESSILENEDVDLDKYLEAYKEFIKFCDLLGSIFGFVSTEITSKVDVMINLRNSENGHNFRTLKTMVSHERDSGLLKKSEYVSGCRTLLRLHRGLDFLRSFLKKLGEMTDDEGTCHVTKEIYSNTLGQYHPWILRQGAYIAMWSMPHRGRLLKTVCGEQEKIQRSLEILPAMLETTNEVYLRTEKCFETNSLMDLP